MTAPLVDIVMPTYNHEKFIAQAIESVLAQKTTFAYRLLIGDDCSTDDTQAIVRDYAAKYPNKIEFIFSPINLGAQHRDRVVVQIFKRCTARYLALLEGDDYWTDPHKLDKQVKFLENHADVALCFHNVERFFADGSVAARNMYQPDQRDVSTLEDILAAGVFPMPCAIMFRNHLWQELPESFYKVTNADWMLSVVIAEQGKLGYLPDVMAAYRVHGKGMWSGLTTLDGMREQIKTYQTINAYLNHKYDEIISKKISALRESLAQQSREAARACLDQHRVLIRKGEIKQGLKLLFEALKHAPSEVFRPRRFAGILKTSLMGIFHKSSTQC